MWLGDLAKLAEPCQYPIPWPARGISRDSPSLGGKIDDMEVGHTRAPVPVGYAMNPQRLTLQAYNVLTSPAERRQPPLPPRSRRRSAQ